MDWWLMTIPANRGVYIYVYITWSKYGSCDVAIFIVEDSLVTQWNNIHSLTQRNVMQIAAYCCVCTLCVYGMTTVIHITIIAQSIVVRFIYIYDVCIKYYKKYVGIQSAHIHIWLHSYTEQTMSGPYLNIRIHNGQ